MRETQFVHIEISFKKCYVKIAAAESLGAENYNQNFRQMYNFGLLPCLKLPVNEVRIAKTLVVGKIFQIFL